MLRQGNRFPLAKCRRHHPPRARTAPKGKYSNDEERTGSTVYLQQFVTFCRVVDLQSFTLAARELSLSQPAVTKQVRALEAALGAQLLRRRGRQLRLTPAGEVVYPYAKRIIHTVLECKNALHSLQAPGRGTLSIATAPTIALFTLPDVLGQFAREHPLVTVHLRTGSNAEVAEMVLREEVDLGILPLPFTHEDLVTTPLFHDPILLVSNPQAPWAKRTVLEPVELSRIPLIGYRRGSQFRNFVDAHFDAAGITPNQVMEMDSHEAVKIMVQQGFGIAPLPESAVKDDLEKGSLIALSVAGMAPLGRTTSTIIRRDHPRSEPVNDFFDLLRRTFPMARTADGLEPAQVPPIRQKTARRNE